MDEIKQWLEGPCDYEAGVALFCKHGRNRNLKQYLKRKNDPLKLRYELSKLAGLAVSSLQQEIPVVRTMTNKAPDALKPEERLKILRDGGINFRQLPESLQQVYLESCEAFRLMRQLHEKMKLADTDDARAAIRAQLVEQTERNRTCWAVLDRWAADGTLPEPPKQKAKSGADNTTTGDAKALNAARVGITRYLNLLDKTTDERKRENYLAKLRESVAVVTTAGCDFGKNAPRLKALGLIA